MCIVPSASMSRRGGSASGWTFSVYTRRTSSTSPASYASQLEREAEVEGLVAREGHQDAFELVESALPAPDLEELLVVEDERLAVLPGAPAQLERLLGGAFGAFESRLRRTGTPQLARQPARRPHEARLPLQPGLAELGGQRGGDLFHRVHAREVAALPSRAARRERGVDPATTVLQPRWRRVAVPQHARPHGPAVGTMERAGSRRGSGRRGRPNGSARSCRAPPASPASRPPDRATMPGALHGHARRVLSCACGAPL